MRDKDEIRKDVWQSMRDAGVAAFPGAVGRIPNFTGLGAGTSSASRVGGLEEGTGD